MSDKTPGISIDCTCRPYAIPIYKDIKNNKCRIIPYTNLKKYYNYTEPEYCNYMKDWLNVYNNQYIAGSNILDYFYDGINSVLLLAEMQSGKTGTVRYVVHALQNLSGPYGWNGERFIKENMYFICGMNDNDLRAQAIKEFKGFIPESNILFSKQLQSFNYEPYEIKPSFIIIDESHYASFKSSQVDLFLSKIDKPDLLKLSVSATAMAELAATEKNPSGKVYLKPADGYYGMADLFSRDLIKQSVDITKDQKSFIDLVIDEYESQIERLEPKYNIVRLPNQWYYRDLQDDIEELDLQINFINHHTSLNSSSEQDFNKYISQKPERFTIIWIYGSLRAGKQLDTTHIGFVHDTSSSGPDIIAQSLMGRILGYNKDKHRVTCYTDVRSAKLMLTWVKSIYDTMKIPSGCKGIKGGYSESVLSKNWELHVPIFINFDIDMRSHYRALKQRYGNRYPYKEEMFIDIALSSTKDREKIINIFETYSPGHCGGLMILTENNKKQSYNDHWTSNYRAYLDNKMVHCCNVSTPGKFFYMYVNLNINSLQYGTGLLTYKEHVNLGGVCDRISVRINERSRFY